MNMNGVIDTTTGKLKRSGFGVDFQNDGSFDAASETYVTNVEQAHVTENIVRPTTPYHRWHNSVWELHDPNASSWVDLRTASIPSLSLEMTTGLTASIDSTHGLLISGAETSYNMGCKVGAHTWNRADTVTFSMIISVKDVLGLFMIGIGDTALDVNNMPQVYNVCQILVYANSSGYFSRLYGVNQSHMVSPGVQFEVSTNASRRFFKIEFVNSGSSGSAVNVYLVDPDNWDTNTATWGNYTSLITSEAPTLLPFIMCNPANPVHLVGFKIAS